MRTMMKIKDETEKLMDTILDEGINANNLEHLSDLVDIHKDISNEEYWCMKEEVENMYGNYRGHYGRHDREYGGYDRNYYGKRERDSRGRYRGHEYIDDIDEHYGRYMDSRQRYGANEDTKRSLKYMLESMEDFAKMLRQDAQSEEEVMMIRETAQRIANM